MYMKFTFLIVNQVPLTVFVFIIKVNNLMRRSQVSPAATAMLHHSSFAPPGVGTPEALDSPNSCVVSEQAGRTATGPAGVSRQMDVGALVSTPHHYRSRQTSAIVWRRTRCPNPVVSTGPSRLLRADQRQGFRRADVLKSYHKFPLREAHESMFGYWIVHNGNGCPS